MLETTEKSSNDIVTIKAGQLSREMPYINCITVSVARRKRYRSTEFWKNKRFFKTLCFARWKNLIE
jgi:hypothetical protein